MGSALVWFLLRRPVRASEIVIGGWLMMITLHGLADSLLLGDFQRVLLRRSGLTVAGATLIAFCTLLAQRRWRAILLAIVIALPTGAVGGLIQTDRCPHATYVNVAGVTIAVSGKACHNPRHFKPWWQY